MDIFINVYKFFVSSDVSRTDFKTFCIGNTGLIH